MALIDELEAAFQSITDIADYRITLGAGRSFGLGIRDNDVGSVYSPLSFSDSIGGGFMLQWRDGRLSRGALDGNSLQQWDTIISMARGAAYDDPDAAQFLGPQDVHHVPLRSPDVALLFDERTDYLFEVIHLLQAIAARYQVKTLNGGTGAGLSESWLRTSRGLDLHAESSSFSYSASFDGIIGEGARQRIVTPMNEIEELIEIAGGYLQQLRQNASPDETGELLIVLHPDVAYSMFSFFVWGNMSGSAVFHGQSPWRREDFVERLPVLRSDFQVRVDPWKPLGRGSFGWTSEGLPSAPLTYIEDGRLVSPILDLKYAKRLSLPPLTPPGNQHSVHIEAGATSTFDTTLNEITDGVLVLSVLGLHTQDRSSGAYSLSAPQALLIKNGEIQGRVKATLSGNFFEHLRDNALKLVQFPNQHSPGFAYPGRVTFERV